MQGGAEIVFMLSASPSKPALTETKSEAFNAHHTRIHLKSFTQSKNGDGSPLHPAPINSQRTDRSSSHHVIETDERHPVPPSSWACTHRTVGRTHHWNTCCHIELFIGYGLLMTIFKVHTRRHRIVYGSTVYSLQYSYVTVCCLRWVTVPVCLEPHQQDVRLHAT